MSGGIASSIRVVLALAGLALAPVATAQLDMDAALGGGGNKASSTKGANSMDAMLEGANEQIEAARAQQARQQEIARLQAEERKLQAEIDAEQRRVAANLRKQALAEKKRREEAADNTFGKALFGAALGYGVGSAAGLDSAASLEMASEYMQAVAEDNPAAMQSASKRITNDYIARRNGQLQDTQSQISRLSGGASSTSAASGYSAAGAKPPRVPRVCAGYSLANYKTGGIVGDPQIDTQCQSVMARYDQYASNVGHPAAKPDQLEKAYQNHLTAAAILDRYEADTRETSRVTPGTASSSKPPAPPPNAPPPMPSGPPCTESCGSQR